MAWTSAEVKDMTLSKDAGAFIYCSVQIIWVEELCWSRLYFRQFRIGGGYTEISPHESRGTGLERMNVLGKIVRLQFEPDDQDDAKPRGRNSVQAIFGSWEVREIGMLVRDAGGVAGTGWPCAGRKDTWRGKTGTMRRARMMRTRRCGSGDSQWPVTGTGTETGTEMGTEMKLEMRDGEGEDGARGLGARWEV